MSEQSTRPALYELLGVPDGVRIDDLRLAYDRAMAMAVRMGDNQRALALSQAFDALPGGVRQQVYPAVQHRRASLDLPSDASGGRRRRGASGLGSAGLGSAGGRGRGRRVGRRAGGRLGRGSRVRRRTVAIAVLVVLAVPLIVTVVLHWHAWLKRPDDGPAVPPPPASTVVQLVPAVPASTQPTAN